MKTAFTKHSNSQNRLNRKTEVHDGRGAGNRHITVSLPNADNIEDFIFIFNDKLVIRK